MRHVLLASLSALGLLAQPVLAGEPAKPDSEQAASDKPAPDRPNPDRPITDREVNAVDVATTPMTDLNIRKAEIPQLLVDAQASPYAVRGLGRCAQIISAVGEFDAILGDDVDLPAEPGRRVSPGRVAQSVVGSFIPFRGIIRELSGANAQDRQVQAAIQAGVARRAFLKGYGEARGCRYPARSATPAMWEARAKAMREESGKGAAEDDKVAAARRK
jgi:hypothetical protein